MNIKKHIKISIALVFFGVFIFVLFYFVIFRNYTSLYFPHEEKKTTIQISKKSVEPAIYIYKNYPNILVVIYDKEGKKVETILPEKHREKELVFASPGEKYTIVAKNTGNRLVYSGVNIYDND